MGSQRNTVLIHYLDSSGRSATNFFTLQDQSDAVPAALKTLADKIQACSSLKVTSVQLQTTSIRAPAFTAGPYSTVMDRVNMLGQVGANTVGYDLVGPRATILQPDGKRLDLDHADVIALVNAMKAVIGNGAGDALTSIKRGTRQWASTRG